MDLKGGESIVAKIGDGSHDLTIEAYMLNYLRAHSDLPVPEVYHAEADLLLMEYVAGETSWDHASLAHLGKLVANCHQNTAPEYGLERDTLIGPLHQPNPPTSSWIEFFREHRLRYIIGLARQSGELPAEMEARLQKISARLERFLIEPEGPALIHGDMWRTNVIVRQGRVAGIIDPAIYYAHSEMELAYMTLFDKLSDAFFAAYCDIKPIDAEFFSSRRHIYGLYPLLIHLIIFGGRYLQPIDDTLTRFGY